MTTEDRLRDALRTRVSQVEPDDGWAHIEARTKTPRRKPAAVRYLSAAAVLLVGVVGFAVIATHDDHDQPVLAGPTPSSSALPQTSGPQYVFPSDKDTHYDTPASLAKAFARDFLGMPDSTVGEFRQGDTRSGEIDVYAFSPGLVTTLLVRQETTGWMVIGSSASNIQVDTPERRDTLDSPFSVAGRSVAFEGTVHVTLLALGTPMRCVASHDPMCGSKTRVLADEIFTGNGTELTPFETSLKWDISYRGSTAVLVLWTDSARDGSLQEATTRLVTLPVRYH